MKPGRHVLLYILLRSPCLLAGGYLLGAWDGPAQAQWSAVAEQKTSYTTDAFQFSSARRLRLTEDPSQPTVVSADKPEDVIWEPALEVIHSTPTAQGKNELSVKAQGAIYTNNPIFNHADYRIQDRFSLDRATSVLVRYRYVPNLFLGPNFERRTGTRSIQEERVSSHHWRAELERHLTESVTGTFVARSLRPPAVQRLVRGTEYDILDDRPATRLSSDGLADADAELSLRTGFGRRS